MHCFRQASEREGIIRQNTSLSAVQVILGDWLKVPGIGSLKLQLSQVFGVSLVSWTLAQVMPF